MIYTPKYSIETPHCLSFDIHQHSAGSVPILDVYSSKENSLKKAVHLERFDTDMGVEWSSVQVIIS